MESTNSKFDRLSVDIRDRIARITLRNPPLNVIDIPMMDELSAALGEIESEPMISIVVLRGEGTSFSAGVDVAAHAPDQVASMLEKFHHVIRTLIATRKITVASVHGRCLGGGAELALVCDVVITAEYAEWGFPEISLGCFPPVACSVLPALAGQKRAADLILTGRKFNGLEASVRHLATSAVPEHQLEDKVEELLARLGQLSPAVLGITKKAIYAWDSIHFDKGLARAEKIYLDELMQTADAHEGIQAFMEKRQPKWKSR